MSVFSFVIKTLFFYDMYANKITALAEINWIIRECSISKFHIFPPREPLINGTLRLKAQSIGESSSAYSSSLVPIMLLRYTV